ncbi:MAG: aminotransferase class I/II-fold pyridoxal phosphate-dependent enzyme [Anditalea sp.]
MNKLSITSRINRMISFAGNEFLYFSGTAYLGMCSLPEFEEMIISGLRQYGSNYGASRFSNVQLDVYEEVETFFATQAGAEKAAVMSSGFMAGYVTAATLKSIVDEIWIAPDTHPAIIPDGLWSSTSGTFDQFMEKCIVSSQKLQGKTIAILANTVDPLQPAIHSFDWIRDLSDKNAYYLLLDDSHAFGLVGKGIFGTYASWKDIPAHLIISGSLGKALGIPAGIILGPADFIQKITSHPIFIGASPPVPGYCAAFLSAQELYAHQQRKLRKNMAHFFSQARHMKELYFQENFPVATFKTSQWADRLKEKQVLISSFPYLNPQEGPVDRIILSAYHETGDLDKLAKNIKGYHKQEND